MQIIRARVLGMCMGVRRADELARQAAQEAANEGARVFTYGPLIHNPQAVAELEALGVHVLDT
ncbi:MAG TPA: 4-hydroxy-3-methylbut-2-enyl diphosphate reductase, partial [Spirochaetaceae bacterium]|nr:4-hydroxy-3-methylbut-2-enyl diphosphate reductase [Spirochaetaceae bacterium]